jgi:hypothetical protein
LKPRRHELLQSLPKDWLETMRYGIDCPPTFAHAPKTCKEYWRLIRVFTERWHGYPPLSDVGQLPQQLYDIEARFGRKLSWSVREWVAFADDLKHSTKFHDIQRGFFQPLEQIHESAISLLHEGAYYWAVRHQDMNLIDPPVYTYLQNPQTYVVFENRRAVETVSEFALDRVLTKVYATGGGGFEAAVKNRNEVVRQLQAVLPHQFSFGEVEIFEGDNILAQLRPRSDLIDLQVEVLKSVPRESIPGFLWEYSRTTTALHGVFLPDD